MNKENSEIAGTWKQGAAALSLTLKKTPLESRVDLHMSAVSMFQRV
jgi:hypothetical protein